MDESELKKKGDLEDGKPSGRKPRHPEQVSNIQQVHAGTPLGVAAPHIYTHARHALSGSETIHAAYVNLELPELLKRRVVGFLGNFGSGKTEVAVNFAMQLGLAMGSSNDKYEGPVSIIDLDIVNPYFRSREAIEPLSAVGVDVISPTGEHFWADLPIILPEIRGRLKMGTGTLILDVGGDDLGARVLSHMKEDFSEGDYVLGMVVNANRPFTSDIEGASRVLSELNEASGLKIGGLIANTHLMDETSPDEVRRGYNFAKEMGESTGLPVLMVSVESHLIDIESSGDDNRIKPDEFGCPVLPLYRFMLPPWSSQQVRGRPGGESRAIGQNRSNGA